MEPQAKHQRWQALYYRSIANQVDQLIALIRLKKRDPDSLARHFDSIVIVIEEAAAHPDLETRTNLIKLLQSLHPLPLWWGKWTEWMRILGNILQIAKENRDVDALFWLYLTQSEILITGGDKKKALVLAESALKLAHETQAFEMIFKAEMAVFEAKKDLGYIGDRTEALHELDSSLQQVKKNLSLQKTHILELEFLLKKTDVLRRLGKRKKALQTIQQAHTLADECLAKDDLLRADIYNRSGAAYWTAEEPQKAIAEFEKATDIFEKWGDQASKVFSLGYIGLVWWSCGEYPKAEAILQSSIGMAEQIKALQWQAIQTGNLGLVQLMQGNLEHAFALIKQHYDLSELINNRAEIERANANLGYVQVFRGNFEDAHERFLRYLAFTKKMNFPIGSGVASAHMAWVKDALGEEQAANAYAEDAFRFAKIAEAPLLEIVALRSMSELKRDANERMAYAQKALILAQKHGRRFNKAGALFTLAHASANQKTEDDAKMLLKELKAEKWLRLLQAFPSLRLPLLYWG